jgi:DUF4097 and DUF4098 domain-containing protein YvlB
MSDARKMILNMLAEGKITVEESEKLLAALGSESSSEKRQTREEPEQEQPRREEPRREQQREDNDSEGFNPFRDATKLGFDLRNLAQTVQHTVQHAIKKAEPRSREFKDKMKEFGNWMQDVVGTMAAEIGQVKGDPIDGVSVDFMINPPEGAANCTKFNIENIFGEIRIQEGPEFKIHVNGRISRECLGEYQPAQWFARNGMRIDENTMLVGFDKNQSVKALMDMEVTLPPDLEVSCKTVSSAIRIRGRYRIGELKTVSGNIRLQGADLRQSLVETVSGTVQIEGGEIDLQIKSTSGDFLVRSSKIEALKINSVSGDILLTEGTITEKTDVKLVTTSGDIIVEKMDGPWSRVEATTRSGDTILDWKGDATPMNNQGTSLKSGAEGAIFKAESVSGDIQFT